MLTNLVNTVKEMKVWKDVVEFEGFYQVSDSGDVRSVDRHYSCTDSLGRVTKDRFKKGKVIAQREHKFGYSMVTLSKANVRYTRTVHKLMAMAFLGKTENDGLVVRHLDGNCKNNALSNLALGTQQDNVNDALVHGTVEQGEDRYNAILTAETVLAIREEKHLGATNTELARKYHLTEIKVHQLVTGAKWKSVGGHIQDARKSKKLTKEECESLVVDRNSGMTYSKMKEKYGISATQITNILKRELA